MNEPGAQGVKVDITDQLQQVRLFLADDGFVAVLKQVPTAAMAKIESRGVSSQQPAHEAGEAAGLPDAQQKMCMVVEQRPGKAIGAGLLQQMREAVKEGLSVLIIEKDLSSFDAPDDDMLEKTWIVDASGSWHGGKLADAYGKFNNFTASPSPVPASPSPVQGAPAERSEDCVPPHVIRLIYLVYFLEYSQQEPVKDSLLKNKIWIIYI